MVFLQWELRSVRIVRRICVFWKSSPYGFARQNHNGAKENKKKLLQHNRWESNTEGNCYPKRFGLQFNEITIEQQNQLKHNFQLWPLPMK